MKIMKTSQFYLTRFGAIVLLAISMSVSCQDGLGEPEEVYSIQNHYTQITFEAVSGDEFESTRTIRNEDGSLSWLPNDEINVFCGEGIYGRFISDNTEIADRTTFTGHFNTDVPASSTQEYWAVYPYSSTNSFDGSRVTLTVPSVQISSPGTFGAGMFPAVAKSYNTRLAFYNVCGLIKFSLSRGDIDYISLSSNGEEPLAGKVKVSFGADGKPVTESVEGTSEITLRPASGNCFEQGEHYFFSVIPGTLSSGFTMSFHTIDNEEGLLETSGAITIKRAVSSKKDNIDNLVADWHDAGQGQDLSETGVYLGILAFNQALYTCPVTLLTPESLETFNSFIDDLQMKNGTILYYAADQGLSNMKQGECPKSLASASLVTFTDGLDQGSLMLNSDYDTEDKYLNAVSARIRSGNVFGLPLSAYSIGVRGSDVQNIDKFQKNLKLLASSEQNAYEISDMSQLNARFQEIAQTAAVTIEYTHNIDLTIPGLPDGTKVRFTFDRAYHAEDSELYIEGTFNLNSKTLSNVSYHGLSSGSGSAVAGTVDGIFVKFNFTKVRKNDGGEMSNSDARQWQKLPGSSSWQKNSEFDSVSDTDVSVSVTRKSALVYLILDCSSSLGGQFSTMKGYVKNFINRLYEDSYIETSISSITISQDEITLEEGETAELSVRISPATATNKTVYWHSFDSGIVRVSSDGTVTAVSPGQSFIVATSEDGGYSVYCEVTILQKTDSSQGQGTYSQSGLYLGVLAFNQGLYRYPITRLTEESAERICSFIDKCATKKGSLVYFAADEAVSDIQAPDYPSDLSNAALVTFTDCLDQGSFMQKPYRTNEDYLSAVKQHISAARVNSLPLSAYSIGIRGSDVTDVSGYISNLQNLASSESNAYEITDISSLKDKLNDIADVVSVSYEYVYTYDLSVTIPGHGNGTRVRFTFDNVGEAPESSLYIEGTFNLSSKTLSEVRYVGFSPAGSTIQGRVEGIFVTFTFSGLHKTDNSELSSAYIKEWTSEPGSSSWQINSEFDNSNDVKTEVSQTVVRRSAVIYLVLDYSTSIGRQASTMKTYAKDFVNTLQDKAYDPTLVSGISLSKSSWNAICGMAVPLSATVFPESALDKSVRWNSTDSSVATVSSEGVVTAVSPGTCTIEVTTNDGGFTANCEVAVKESHIEAIDLGLTVKWASFNVGATKPEEFGDYFAWGEVEPKTVYNWSTYKWCKKMNYDLTKYNKDRWYGTVDNKTTLDLEDDAAHVNWGGSWRMPTRTNIQELIDNCTAIWTTENGVYGHRFTSKKEGYTDKSIFIPAAGHRSGSDSSLHGAGSLGYYWSSSLKTDYPNSAHSLFFESREVCLGDDSILRPYGLSVRPVCE